MKGEYLFKILVIIFIFFGQVKAQNRKTSKEIESVLIAAGKNRNNLDQFLNHYKDSNDLKWKSACFLVENMDIHYSEIYHWEDEKKM